ncbi:MULTISPECIES: hypothetical protein [unclassified Fibrobacter]|uniref:hypothetical protein n=1 Tax=unclassified Fibrobacter TaxID=2634177 RepID=UPI000B5214BF|nr:MULTISPECIES: hypothetical protein [unclassified Fibrobacter]OWV03528.1 hypothetical protein B7992_16130 [Fibrobacter sp. UWH1]PWJ54979.1 hypothetical protein BGX12_1705 [Fibrobacter sp. UWR4]PZW61938.1 hypothetical protein C8E88_10735 [Fibrobacter sp. UWR1]
MPEVMSVYESLPLAAKQEINDFIYFVAARVKFAEKEATSSKKMDAFKGLLKFKGCIPQTFDADAELENARMEKYGK